MALQLKNKVKEDKPVDSKKSNGKYKRRRNVFGKRTTRYGLIGFIAVLALSFAVIKVCFTLSQNNRQNKIDEELEKVLQTNEDYQVRIAMAKKQAKYENVGELIATLPVNFDKQATNLDLDRIVSLSGLKEVEKSRTIIENEVLPFACSVSTVKCAKISMGLTGENNDIDTAIYFIDLLHNYSQENFYYVSDFDYTEDWSFSKNSKISITFYTFYNEINLNPQTNTDTNTQTTTTA